MRLSLSANGCAPPCPESLSPAESGTLNTGDGAATETGVAVGAAVATLSTQRSPRVSRPEPRSTATGLASLVYPSSFPPASAHHTTATHNKSASGMNHLILPLQFVPPPPHLATPPPHMFLSKATNRNLFRRPHQSVSASHRLAAIDYQPRLDGCSGHTLPQESYHHLRPLSR